MKSVLVMMMFAMMLVLVVAQADDSSSKTTAPSLPPQDDDEPGGDCGKLCAEKCYLEKCIPKHYKICLDLCKLHCEHPLSYDIYHCTSACAASMSTKLGSDAHKVKGEYVGVCYNNCKKNN